MNQKKSMGLDNIMPKRDAAMYEAKRRGKNGYVIYSTIEDIFELKQVVDREKTQALLDGKFEVRYIPVMNISSSTLAAAKSYIVWNRGDVVWREENFLEFFEENGFVVELEQYAFTKICEMLVSSKDPLVKQIPIIFTTSGVNINRVNFVDGMLAEVRSYGLKPDYFIFQLDNINDRIETRRVIHFFEDIRNAGFGTALKGFGSAGASLMLMKNLALDYVSLGKGVISNLLKDNREGLFVKNILSLINDLNFEAVVEGIDDAMQVRYLNSYGCNLGSGSLFSDALEQQEYIRFAGKNSQITQQSVKFELRANLKDNSGKYEGVYLGDGREQFLYNSELHKEVLYCNGGKMLKGVIELPKEIVETQNFSVAIKFKVNNFINWSSLFYIMYENAFLSFMPFAWNGLCMYRIKDDLDEDGWYDIIGNKIDREWHTVVLTYNHKNRTAMLYVDGKKTGLKDPVINLQSPKRVILGGDIYAKSFEGFIDYLEVYDYVLSPRDVEKIVDK
jgi:EAL domain-containing protein (putative c-di-GMP-specific phosphodiesterase class I)